MNRIVLLCLCMSEWLGVEVFRESVTLSSHTLATLFDHKIKGSEEEERNNND